MKKLIYGFLAAVILVGCYPKGPTYVSDLDLVLTNHSDTFNFNAQQTYFLFDTVVKITDGGTVDSKFDSEILDKVDENMLNMGYTKLNVLDGADVVLTTSAWSVTTTNFYYDWYGYWGWGYPGYGSGWGWGYPGYGWSWGYSYTTGTILIEMSYPAGADVEDQYIPLVWGSAINGLISGSNSDTRQRIDVNIDQAFAQSPYLLSNP